MGVKRARNSIVAVLVLLVALSIIQCTAKPQIVKENDEAILRRRVQEYWSYRVKGELDKSYQFESPDYREKISIVRYINQYGRLPMVYEGFEILEVWTSGDEGHAKLNTKYRYLIPQTTKAAFESVVEEQWVKKEKQWYHLSPLV